MNTMAFAEAIQIKVMESDESFALDEVSNDPSCHFMRSITRVP